MLHESYFVLSPSEAYYYKQMHLDNRYIGESLDIHNKTLFIRAGKHKLFVLDARGNSTSVIFNVLRKDGTF